jgi:hypothetical protein
MFVFKVKCIYLLKDYVSYAEVKWRWKGVCENIWKVLAGTVSGLFKFIFQKISLCNWVKNTDISGSSFPAERSQLHSYVFRSYCEMLVKPTR